MSNTQSKLAENRKRKAETEKDISYFEEQDVEIFLKIFIVLIIKDPEEIENEIKQSIYRPDGAGLNAILLVVSKLSKLLKYDIESLKLPKFMKTSLKVLEAFLDFLKTRKILDSLKNATSKNSNAKRKKTAESSSDNIESDQ